ncbi:MAG: metallophosphoesterase [Clostridiales bacterium]|uniref:metallophosphoesterase n=1 Tax=Aminipila sp. TaxID=2060095 RepID=UPI001D9B45F3|nr:metallophosphoesterase [Aminipila sp.]MBE6033693.1 metallophosphoesterase [Clostridiales bacterium]
MIKFIKTIFELFMLILILITIAFGYARYIEPYQLRTIELSLEDPQLQVSAHENKLKIAVFSDTHFSDWYTTDDFQEVITRINEQSPDMVFFVGDLIDNFNTYTGDVNQIIDCLSRINAPLGKFAVYGNHDYGGGAEWEYEGIMQSGGFTVLTGDYYALDDLKLAIIGIDDILIGGGSPAIASWGREDYYNIILCHEPDIVDEILDYNVNLMISGHTHGGQINIPFYTSKFLPPYGEKYLKGLFEFENHINTKLYVTSGIGMTKLPFRFLAPPDVTFITLYN